MPNELLEIPVLNGMVCNIDINDCPLDKYFWGLNVDGNAIDGKLIPLTSLSANTSYISTLASTNGFFAPVHIVVEGTDLIVHDLVSGSNITTYINNSSILTVSNSGVEVNKIKINDVLYLANGSSTSNAIKLVSPDSFSVCAINNESLSATLVTATAGGSASGYFKTGINYIYTFSITLDGFQESILFKDLASKTVTPTIMVSKIDITLPDNNSLNSRITHYNLYRKDEVYAGAGYYSAYRLVTTVSSASVTSTITDTGIVGPDYEDNAGIPEEYNKVAFGHSLSAYVQSYYVMGRINYLDFGANVLVRSLRYRPSMYNLTDTSNILSLEEDILHLIAYKDKLLAFGKNNCYLIDMLSFTVEQKIVGLGIPNYGAVCNFRDTIYVANFNGVYELTGNGMQDISLPIKKADTTYVSSAYGYLDNSVTNFYLNYSGKKNALILTAYKSDTNASYTFLYNVIKKRWDATNIGYNAGIKTCPLPNGDTLVALGTGIYNLFGTSASTCSMEVYKAINANTPSQKKMYFDTRSEGGTVSTYLYNPGSTTSATASKGNYFGTAIMKITGASEVKSIALIYRNLIGVR